MGGGSTQTTTVVVTYLYYWDSLNKIDDNLDDNGEMKLQEEENEE